MNKLKKLIVLAVSMVMALAFAVPAFAMTDAEIKAELIKYLGDRGIDATQAVEALTPEQVSSIKTQKAELQTIADDTIAQAKAEPAKAQEIVNAAVAKVEDKVPDVKIENVAVQVQGDKISATAAVTVGTNPPIQAAAAVPLPTSSNDDDDDDDDDEPVATTNTTPAAIVAAPAANPIIASSTSVIKATGDNSAVVVVAAVLSVVAVLGLGVRKNRSMTVA